MWTEERLYAEFESTDGAKNFLDDKLPEIKKLFAGGNEKYLACYVEFDNVNNQIYNDEINNLQDAYDMLGRALQCAEAEEPFACDFIMNDKVAYSISIDRDGLEDYCDEDEDFEDDED